MTPAEFICGLMRENTNALGFIPKPAIQRWFINPGRYLLQQDRFGRAVGYLLHGPVHNDGHLKIHQACIRLDKRNRHFGAQVVHQLLTRAAFAAADRITLRCAWDLDANSFWTAHDFHPIRMTEGGRRRQRMIITYQLDLNQPLPVEVKHHVHQVTVAPMLRFPTPTGEPTGSG